MEHASSVDIRGKYGDTIILKIIKLSKMLIMIKLIWIFKDACRQLTPGVLSMTTKKGIPIGSKSKRVMALSVSCTAIKEDIRLLLTVTMRAVMIVIPIQTIDCN